MKTTLKVLAVHGTGRQENAPDWFKPWTDTITAEVLKAAPGFDTSKLTIEPLEYQSLFKPYFDKGRPNAGDYARGLWLFGGSLITHGLFGREARGFGDFPDDLKWAVGMVVLWGDDAKLRGQLRDALSAKIKAFQPDVVLGHSLGSLISYDTFIHDPAAIQGRDYVTFGAQIGNPAVANTFGGRVVGLPGARRWFHLHDPNDRVLTASIRDSDPNFTQVEITGSNPLALSTNHKMEHYLTHPATEATVWPRLVGTASVPGARSLAVGLAKAMRRPAKRALLVGINNYPDPANRLEGCVNDVFRWSATLQECGFDAEDIRVVLDDRATAQGIRDRIGWLLDGVNPGDQRVLVYSGHGAQLPAYSANETVDHMDECLVPWDFDWTPEKAITDDEFLQYYLRLPYDSHFAAIFDCCHSGGMSRGAAGKPRGIQPPDDIRHRRLRWDAEEQAWRVQILTQI